MNHFGASQARLCRRKRSEKLTQMSCNHTGSHRPTVQNMLVMVIFTFEDSKPDCDELFLDVDRGHLCLKEEVHSVRNKEGFPFDFAAFLEHFGGG